MLLRWSLPLLLLLLLLRLRLLPLLLLLLPLLRRTAIVRARRMLWLWLLMLLPRGVPALLLVSAKVDDRREIVVPPSGGVLLGRRVVVHLVGVDTYAAERLMHKPADAAAPAGGLPAGRVAGAGQHTHTFRACPAGRQKLDS